MKPKTIAESIAELRNRLEEIDSVAPANLLQESNSSNRLLQHMHAIENESMSESVASGALNFFRGMKGGEAAAKGAADTWKAASAAEKEAAKWGGRASTAGLVGTGYQASKWMDDKPNMFSWAHDKLTGKETPPEAPTAPTAPVTPPTAPVTPPVTPTEEPTAPHKGGGAKPHHSGGHRDPEIEQLQNYLNSKGANLVVDGIRGPKTNAAIAQFMPADGQAPAGQTAPATQASAPTADADYNKQMQSSLDQLKDLMGKIQQLSGNDPSVAQDLQNIMKPLQ